MEDVAECLDSSDIHNAKRKLEEGTELVQKRVKAIKLADKSEYGWATFNKHLSDELASDTDDLKWMYYSDRRTGRRYKDQRR